MAIGDDPTGLAPSSGTRTSPDRPGSLPRALGVGDRIDRYVITGELGAGGMGVVWAAHDPELERTVAIKLVRASGFHRDARERLLREAKAMAKLAHPAVVPVFDAGTIGDEVFIAMELVDGSTLKQALRERTRTWREIVALFVQAGSGLAAAHAAGIIHRDFKPENVLVGRDGRARVTDFGLARLGDRDDAESGSGSGTADGADHAAGSGDQGLTRPGAVMGTPAYMAPEQHRGETATALADQFSFCVALWAALYGSAPFPPAAVADGTSSGATGDRAVAALADAVTGGRLAPPANRGAVPTWLYRILVRGLAVDRGQRWPSMAALLAAIDAGPRRRRRIGAAIGAAGAALVGGGVALAILAGRGTSEDPARVCTTVAQRLAGAWDDDVRARGSKAFTATGMPFAATAWTRVETALQAYATAWTHGAVDSCEATYLRRDQPEPIRELRDRCFTSRLDSLRALAAALTVIQPTEVERTVTATNQLPDLAVCDDVPVLQALPLPPATADQRVRADALAAELAAINADLTLGRYQPVIDRSTKAVAAARELGYAPRLALALFELGTSEYELRRGDAVTHLEEAANVAEQIRDDLLRFRALDKLAMALGAAHRFDAAKLASKQATAVISRLGFRPDLEMTTRMTQAAIALWQEDITGMLALQEEALTWAQKIQPPDDLLVAKVRLNLSGTLQRLRRFDDAIAQLDASKPIIVRALGADHPQLGAVMNTEAVLTYLRGDYAGSIPKYEATIAYYDRVLGPESAGAQGARFNLGLALLDTDRDEEALAAFELGADIDSRRLRPGHPDGARWLIAIGDTALDLGRLDRALEVANQAEAILRGVESSTFELARVHFLLGRVYWGQGKRAPARKLVAEARATFVAGGAGHAHTVAAIDDWKHENGMK